jgi:hypothetical protein
MLLLSDLWTRSRNSTVAGGSVFLDLKESAAFSMDVVNLLITSRSCPAFGWAILLPSANCNSWLLNEELITSWRCTV